MSYDPSELRKIHDTVDAIILDKSETSLITIDDVRISIASLKPGKADGRSGVLTDHIMHGGHNPHVYLCQLFNSMLIHGISPSSLQTSTLVPIPKDKRKSVSVSDNYRAIALSSPLCKVLDTIILRKDFCKLFREMIQIKIPPLTIRLIMEMYEKQSMAERWNNEYSDSFGVSNGVKQGGVLSPKLFCIYIDNLLVSLKNNDIGCHVGSHFCGAFGYADDIMLVDLVRAYNQVPAIVTPFGLFEYLRMPLNFGLKNAAQTFQRFMDNVFRDMQFVYVYLDDILVASSSVEEHCIHLRQLFERLAEYGLVVNPQKCVLGQSSLDFLGHRVTSDGIHPLQDRVQAIRDYPQPRTAKSLKEYLGLLNFYRRFVPHAAAILLPLYELVSLKDTEFCAAWTSLHEKHFQQSKDALAAATCLAHPSPTAETCINTDASDTAVGAVLQQHIAGVWTPICFFSRKLHSAETKYSAFDKELLAMYLAVKKFRHFIEGRQFTLFTDHKPLTFAFSSASDKWSPRQQRHLAFVSEFTTNVRHVPGVDNVVADALSRVSLEDNEPGVIAAMEGVMTSVINYAAMAVQQGADAGIQRVVSDPNCSLPLTTKKCALPDTNERLLVDMSTGRPRPLVPAGLTRTIFDANHKLSHAGARAMRRLICDRFVWPGMSKDIRQWTRSCLSCQRAKVTTHARAPIEPLSMPSSRFESLHVDLVGPLPLSQGFSYLLTVVDRFTRWPEAIPVVDISAETCARAFLTHWVARFGVPATLTSDRGRQFVSELWKKTAALLGASTNATTAYHPQANGLVERMHRTMKASLKAKLGSDPNWCDTLPVVLLGMRAAVKQDMNCSVAEMVYGEQLRLPGEFFTNSAGSWNTDPSFVVDLRQRMQQVRPVPPVWHGEESRRSFVHTELPTATHVFVRVDAHKSPLQAPYKGPFKVLERHVKYFKLDLGNREDTVSIDRLKPAFMDEPLQDAPVVRDGARSVQTREPR